MPAQPNAISRLLQESIAGRHGATEQLTQVLYDELRGLAASMMHSQPAGHTLQPTALVHEAVLKIGTSGQDLSPAGRTHLFRTITMAMRQLLVDSARRKATLKHGGSRRREEGEAIQRVVREPDSAADPEVFVRLGELLDELSMEDAQASDVVRLRIYAGCSIVHVSEILGISERTVHREFEYARRWLGSRLAPPDSRWRS